jgi:CarD family transcriptional regulator
MRFQAGDLVVHPAHGVGRIVGLEERQLAEDESRLYYVIVADKSTVWMPVDADPAAPLRELTPKREMERYRKMLSSGPGPLEKDHYKRRLEITSRLRQGSFQSLCEVVRDLAARGWRKPLNEADAALLQKIQMDLCREWAAANGMSLVEAVHEVEALLREGRQDHATGK